MMREIKFRFYDKRYSRIMVNTEHIYSVSGDGKVLFIDGHDVSEDIIALQYTGLKDMNGKEIYEGDIIYLDETNNMHEILRTCRVVFEWGSFWMLPIKYKYTTQYTGGNFYNWESGYSSWGRKFSTIIGNIYENPLEE